MYFSNCGPTVGGGSCSEISYSGKDQIVRLHAPGPECNAFIMKVELRRKFVFVFFLLIFLFPFCRLREERGDPDRPLPLDQKVRGDVSPRNGEFQSGEHWIADKLTKYFTISGNIPINKSGGDILSLHSLQKIRTMYPAHKYTIGFIALK